MSTQAGVIIAAFKVKNSNAMVYLKSNIMGGLYRQWRHEQAHSMTAYHAKWDVEDIGKGDLIVVKSPYPMYHCWHVCMCDECAKVGGRTFDHSQGAWDEHLRYVPSDKLFTFPTAKEEVKV